MKPSAKMLNFKTYLKNILFLTIVTFSLSSCSKNSGKESKSIKLSEIYNFKLNENFIQPEELIAPSAVCQDSLGNIYISCSKSAFIYKFSPDLKYLSRFGGKGQGPGEFAGGPVTLIYINGQILSSCYRDMTTNVYNLESEFIKKLPRKLPSGLSGSVVFNNDLLMHLEFLDQKDDEIQIRSTLAKLDKSFSEVEYDIYSYETVSKGLLMPISDALLNFATNEKNLYVGRVSSKDFYIDIYDKNFTKVGKITHGYRTKINDYEQYIYFFNQYGAGFKSKSESKWKDKKIEFKAINRLFTDKDGRLLVISPREKKENKNGEILVDVYEDSNLLGSIKLPFKDPKFYNYVYHLLNLLKILQYLKKLHFLKGF